MITNNTYPPFVEGTPTIPTKLALPTDAGSIRSVRALPSGRILLGTNSRVLWYSDDNCATYTQATVILPEGYNYVTYRVTQITEPIYAHITSYDNELGQYVTTDSTIIYAVLSSISKVVEGVVSFADNVLISSSDNGETWAPVLDSNNELITSITALKTFQIKRHNDDGNGNVYDVYGIPIVIYAQKRSATMMFPEGQSSSYTFYYDTSGGTINTLSSQASISATVLGVIEDDRSNATWVSGDGGADQPKFHRMYLLAASDTSAQGLHTLVGPTIAGSSKLWVSTKNDSTFTAGKTAKWGDICMIQSNNDATHPGVTLGIANGTLVRISMEHANDSNGTTAYQESYILVSDVSSNNSGKICKLSDDRIVVIGSNKITVLTADDIYDNLGASNNTNNEHNFKACDLLANSIVYDACVTPNDQIFYCRSDGLYTVTTVNITKHTTKLVTKKDIQEYITNFKEYVQSLKNSSNS